jgi:hypothetical protein
MQENFPESGFISLNHPSRSLDWSPGEIRDLHNAGPDVVIGMEAIPGHQKSSSRGSYGSTITVKHDDDISYKARTYGGADYMLAQVGGLWDSLLGEGRRFFVATNSDFHRESEDFWPGEYAKHYVYSKDTDDPYELVAGFKSGRSFIVTGDLIDALEFDAASGEGTATMGGVLVTREGDDVRVTIRFKSPVRNNNGDPVAVDHVDLIVGEVTGLKVPGTSDYKHGETNPSTHVVARFSEWQVDDEGYNVASHVLEDVREDLYLRLRGTNLGLGVLDETDDEGNPLCDDLVGTNTEEKAWLDLWFYSNPIFIEVDGTTGGERPGSRLR